MEPAGVLGTVTIPDQRTYKSKSDGLVSGQ